MDKSRRKAIPKKLQYLQQATDDSQAMPIMLIVCEGSETEPIYFNAVAKRLRLAAIEVRGARGSAPMTVVRDAVDSMIQRKTDANKSASIAPYDEVWCVFDVDQHPKLKDAIAFADKYQIEVALSNPCFEFWLLLHFERFAKTNQSRKQIRRELNRHIPKYCKSGDYSTLFLPGLEIAVKNAADIWVAQWRTRAPTPLDTLEKNPSTLVHRLIASLKQGGPR